MKEHSSNASKLLSYYACIIYDQLLTVLHCMYAGVIFTSLPPAPDDSSSYLNYLKCLDDFTGSHALYTIYYTSESTFMSAVR